MRKIFIGAGHSDNPQKDRGAAGCGYIEGELAISLRDKIVKELNILGIKPTTDDNNNVFWETINKFKLLVDPTAIVVDIHFNAATPAATGTETLVPKIHSDFERKLAEDCSKAIGDILDIKLRGWKGVKTEAESHHGSLSWMRLKGENILLEICFITNCSDMQKYCDNENKLAKKLAEILFKYAKDIPTVTNHEYIVQSGDYLSRIGLKFGISVSELKRINGLANDTIHPGQVLVVAK